MLFREIHRVTPTHLQRYLRSLHVTFNPIAGLSLMATKASQAPHFQPKPTMWEFVEEARFALAKTPKSHINHEIDADLSTSELLQFSSRIPQILLCLKALD